MAEKSRVLNFFTELKVELLQKVVWPSRKELLNILLMVIVFVLTWAIYVGLLSFTFAKGLEGLINFFKGG
jgi:preprotein translocase SecE subunit